MNRKELKYKVFPSEEQTISVIEDDTYGGAHDYFIKNCLGFNNGKTDYVQSEQLISFIKKEDDDTVSPGLQSEQLVYVLLDRVIKLNNRFPSVQNQKMIEVLEMFLEASKDRVKNRMERNVMGNLKK